MWNGEEDFQPSGTDVGGIHVAEVVDNEDPNIPGSARVKVRVFPFMKELDEAVLPWAVPAQPLWAGAGPDRGFFGLPTIGSRVYVFFSTGDVTTPVYFAEAPCATDGPSEKDADVRIMKTPAGHLIKLVDTSGAEEIVIEHLSGSKLRMDKDGKVALGKGANELLDLLTQTLTALEQSIVNTQLGPQQLSKVTDGTVTTIKTNLDAIKGSL